MRTFYLALLAGVAAFAQQNSDLLIHHTFEGGTGGWTAMGQGGSVRVTHDAGQTLNGRGALALTYELKAKTFAFAVLPAPPEISGMRRLRFSVRSDHDTVLGVLLSEKKPGGGDYSAWFWSPANTWQQIELTPADFSLNDGPNDPVDADGKLDLDAIQGVGIFDLSQFFLTLPANPEFPMAIDRPSGSHTVLLDDFQVLSSGPAQNSGFTHRSGEIDSFRRGFLEWLTLGGMRLKLSAADNPLGTPALEVSYQQTEGQYALLTRRLSQLDLSKANRLSFDIASLHEATLVVSLELKSPGGPPSPRYNMTIFPPGGKEIFHVNLKLADFEGQGQVDAAKLKSLSITDISTAAGGPAIANTIWIGNVEALKAQ